MNIFIMLFCPHGAPLAPPPAGGCAFNDPAVITSLIWAVVIIVLGALALRYFKKRLQCKMNMTEIEHKHELDLKDKNFNQEKFWHFLNNELSFEECEKKLKESEEKLKKEKEKNEDAENLKKEKEEFEKTVLEEKVKAYKDIIKYIGRCIK